MMSTLSSNPDDFFTVQQQKRLSELMNLWRTARDRGQILSPKQQAELESLVEAELKATIPIELKRQTSADRLSGARRLEFIKRRLASLRYAIAWGADTTAFLQEFDPKLIRYAYEKLTILVGCVDTTAGRSTM